MSLRDTFVRVNRHRAGSPRTAHLDIACWAVLTQVWAIAADEGEQLGEDVVVAADALAPERLTLELPRSVTVEQVTEWLDTLASAGCLRRDGANTVVPRLAAYNRDRFRKRAQKREQTANRSSGSGPGSGDSDPGRKIPSRDGGAVAVAGEVAGQDETDSPALPPAGAAPKRRPRKQPTGPHAEFLAWWCDEFKRAKGEPYAVQHGKDGAAVKAMLGWADRDVATLKARALELLHSTDPFFVDKGVDLGLLRSAWNRLASAGRGRPPGSNGQQLGRTEPGTEEQFAQMASECDENGRWIHPDDR